VLSREAIPRCCDQPLKGRPILEQGEFYDAALGARTQSLFRDVNERVKEINGAFADYVPLGDWVCECANNACTQRVALTTAHYEVVRADPRRFLVAPGDGHVFEEIEAVVERDERFWVVEKEGPAGELAARVDPRRVGLRGSDPVAAAV
jgi:hypothetical protein